MNGYGYTVLAYAACAVLYGGYTALLLLRDRTPARERRDNGRNR